MTRFPTEAQVEEVEALIMRNAFEWEQRVEAGDHEIRIGRANDWMAIVSRHDGIIVSGPTFFNPGPEQLQQLNQHADSASLWNAEVRVP